MSKYVYPEGWSTLLRITVSSPASSCDQQAVVSYLLSVGVDQTVQDADGLTAEEVASESSTQALFHHQTSPVTQ